jgi:hypothetical protein
MHPTIHTFQQQQSRPRGAMYGLWYCLIPALILNAIVAAIIWWLFFC